MKKFLLTLILMAPALAFMGCRGDDSPDEPLPKDEAVKLNLGFPFMQPANMSMGVEVETAYQNFFDNYVKNKKLAPKSYSLSFNNKEGNSAQSVSGLWADTSISIREGTYNVTGTSYPTTYKGTNNETKLASDSLYVNFDESVNINKNATALTLTAKYDCYLLLFNAENIAEFSYLPYISDKAVKPQLAGDVYYLFVYNKTYTENGHTKSLYVTIKKKDGATLGATIGGLGYEKGKYYYFDI